MVKAGVLESLMYKVYVHSFIDSLSIYHGAGPRLGAEDTIVRRDQYGHVPFSLVGGLIK